MWKLRMNNPEDTYIRPATVNDAAVLYQWDEKPHVKAATSDSGEYSFEANWEEELEPRSDGSAFFIAETDGKAIGALQIIDPATEQTHYWGAVAANQRAIDIWIGEEEYIGKGHGTRMMKFAIEHCFSQKNITAILIDPLAKNRSAHRFYKRLGFQFVERRQFDEESDCFVFKLTRDNWHALNN